MNKRPLILRTLIVLVVVGVFASAIHPLFERDYYETFLGLLVKPADPEEAKKVQADAEKLVKEAVALRKADPNLFQSLALLKAADDSGVLMLSWFNASYAADKLIVGAQDCPTLMHVVEKPEIDLP